MFFKEINERWNMFLYKYFSFKMGGVFTHDVIG